MEIIIGETSLKVFENGDIWRIHKNMPDRGYIKCELSPNDGYLHIGIDGKDVLCHRVVASVYLGLILDDLTQIIDHWDHNGLNNDVSNLRVTTYQGNNFNIGAKHYHYCKTTNKWIVRFMIDCQPFILGYFKTEEEAIEKAKDVEKYQKIGKNYIKKEEIVIPKIVSLPKKDLKPNKQGKYTARKVINGTHHFIGRFNTQEEARFAMDNFTI